MVQLMWGLESQGALEGFPCTFFSNAFGTESTAERVFAMMDSYEHPLIFGAREYFLGDADFHDHCLGLRPGGYDTDDVSPRRDLDSNLRSSLGDRLAKSCNAGTQTEPWEEKEAVRSPPPGANLEGSDRYATPQPANSPLRASLTFSGAKLTCALLAHSPLVQLRR